MKERKRNLDMTQGEPAKLLILFAIPMLIGGIFNLMYNMVDTVVVGRYVSTDALAAIGATSSTTMFIMFIGQSATNAMSVIISQAEGAKQEDLMKKCVAHAFYLILIMGSLLGVISFFCARPLLTLLGTPGNIIDNSVTYVKITCGLMLGVMIYNGVTSILRAVGDSRTPLYFLIFSSILNVILDLIFVLAMNGGVAGVAFATVISQIVSAIISVIYMLKRHKRLLPSGDSWRYDGEIIKDYVRIGVPMCVQQTVLCVGMFVITAVINSFGSDIVAAYTIGGKVEGLAVVTFSNVAFSLSVYAGQNYGAKKYDRIREGVKKGGLIVAGLALFSTVMIMILARPVASLFMDVNKGNAEYVLTASMAMVRIEASLYVILGWIWMVNSTLRGIGAVKITLASSIVELASKIGFSLLLPVFFGYIGIWFAAPIGWVLGLIPSAVYLLLWFKNPEKYSKQLSKNKQEAPAEQPAEITE